MCSHGGEHVSKYISEHLHELFETVDPASIPEIIRYTKSHGDYFNRWRGGGLRRWMPDSVEGVPAEGSGMTFEERLVLAFLTVRFSIEHLGMQSSGPHEHGRNRGRASDIS